MTALLLVALGGAVGAPLRYLADRFVQARHDSVFPWGTFAVNATGSLLLGLLAGLAPPGWAAALLGTGLLGTLTTYSTFGYETVRLAREGGWFLAYANVMGSLSAGLGAAYVGLAVAQALTG
ncbi:fluoride efflux transporter FluC [Marinitenerispora sediminis]|uniref:Fluoride-specific ion channel FluC n=1 Tax=Marinitenerispora sediminis TaxID=1931232 RepID=A0A368TB70_9ACTN|nr:CrcB family protein [Marinitenerispora sediminis]RCV50779.1 fluoride efflux transporter CrcB [Marinitenerispora sediminis]RCV52667.1 fluoride efflux transporter CrcB [Marinitenerispora sediminis]RCV62083.1 fluoride efflux transporter CrcB [Marinitenerispora sediminis]